MASKGPARPCPKKKLTLTKALFVQIWVLRFFGFDVVCDKPSRRRQIFFDLMFTFHMLLSLHYVVSHILIGNFSKSGKGALMSLVTVITGFKSIIGKITLRIFLSHFRQVIMKMETLLTKFDGAEQAYLRRMRRLTPLFFLYPVFSASFQWVILLDTLIHPEKYKSDIAKFAAEGVIYRISVVLYMAGSSALTYMWEGVFTVVIWLLMSTLAFIFRHLADKNSDVPIHLRAKLKLKRIVNFLHLHREACQLLKSANRILAPVLMQWMFMHIMSALYFGRISINKDRINKDYLIIALVSIVISTGESITGGMVNKMLVKSLDRLYQLNPSFGKGSMLKRDAEAVAIKAELYALHVLVDPPVVKVGGLIRMTTSTAIKVVAVIVTYIAFLYKKVKD